MARKHVTPATSPESLEIELLKRHLNLAQTKIVDLDNTIVEYDNRVKVLYARLKAFEERETLEVSERYFPRSDINAHKPSSFQATAQASSHASHSPSQPSSSTPSSCCCPVSWFRGLFPQCQPQQESSPTNDITAAIQSLSAKVGSVFSEMEKIKIKLEKLENNNKDSSMTSPPPHPTASASFQQSETSHQSGDTLPATPLSESDVSSQPIISGSPCNDESLLSIEEFIFEDNQSLNCLAPTTQLI